MFFFTFLATILLEVGGNADSEQHLFFSVMSASDINNTFFAMTALKIRHKPWWLYHEL